MTHTPDHIKAVCGTSELLAALESFEQTGCNFGGASNAYIKAVRADHTRETFNFVGVTFEAEPYKRTVLVLTHVAKPNPMNPDVQTLRPFAELLVKNGIRQARLISPGPYTAWVEVTVDGQRWRRLTPAQAEVPATSQEEAPHVDHP